MNWTNCKVLIGCCVMFCCSNAVAEEIERPMFSARLLVGYVQFPDSYVEGDITDSVRIRTKKEDVVGGFAASFNLMRGDWRAELEYVLRFRTDANGYVYREGESVGIRSNLQNQSAGINLRRSFAGAFNRNPYVTVGIGQVRHHSEAEYLLMGQSARLAASNNVEFQSTWHVGIGMEFRTRSGWLVDVGYRYADLGTATTSTFANGLAFSTGNLKSHDILFSIARLP